MVKVKVQLVTVCRRRKDVQMLVQLAMAAALIVAVGVARAQQSDAITCGSLDNNYGPYDYSDPADKATKLPIVEQYHFTQKVETLREGQSGSLMSDLDYTLRAFPNHHRALWAVSQLQLRSPELLAGFNSADCYFERAVRWRANDPTVHTVHAIYLARRGDRKGALDRYKHALTLAPDNAEVHYNLALLYLDMNRKDEAKPHAKRAYELGYPLTGLKNRMIKVGAWTEKDVPSRAAATK
jgi:tetratricopeptide (TPR) repeat protein